MDSKESVDQFLLRVLLKPGGLITAVDWDDPKSYLRHESLSEHELLTSELKKKYGENLSDRDLLIRYIEDFKRENR
jgi:hypothetical protein